jgi:hypothetical protein
LIFNALYGVISRKTELLKWNMDGINEDRKRKRIKTDMKKGRKWRLAWGE